MAARFWVGGSGNWDASTTTHWSATSGGAGGASVPTTSDTVTFDSASNGSAYTVTVTALVSCSDLTFSAPATGDVTWAGASTVTIAGNLTLYSGLIRSLTGGLTFTSTATGKTITTAGVAFNSPIIFNGVGGGWQLLDALNNASASVTLLNGTLDTNGFTLTCGNFASTNSNTRTLTLGASIFDIITWDTTNSTGLTLNPGTSSIRIRTGTNAGFAGGGGTFYELQLNAAGAVSVVGANTFTTLTRTGTAVKTDSVVFSASQTVTGTLTINGNSTTNRMFVTTNVTGNNKTLTAATVSVSNADFQDITGAGAGSWNLSAITGKSGDCGGNSGITFTTAADQYWFKNTGSISDASKFFLASGGTGGAGRVPLPQDGLIFDSASFDTTGQTITQDMPRIPGFSWASVTNSPTLTTATDTLVFGSLTLIAAMTLTASTGAYTFAARSAQTLTSAGNSFTKNITMDGKGGSLTLQDALNIDSSHTLTLASGTFSANNKNVTCGAFVATGSIARTLTMGSGTWTLTGNATTIWNLISGTVSTTTSTIDCTYSGSTGTRGFVSAPTSGRINTVKISAGSDRWSLLGTTTVGGDFDFTGFSGIWQGNDALTVGGYMFLTAAMTSTFSSSITFIATSGPKLITFNGKTFSDQFIFSGAGGSWQFADTVLTTGRILIIAGSLDTNDQTITSSILGTSGSTTKGLSMGASLWTVTGTGTVVDLVNGSTGLTFSAGTSTIKITNSSATAKTFAASKTLNNLWFSPGSGAGSLTFVGSSTFNNFKDDGSAAHSLLFTAGSTQTFTTFNVYGSAGNLITIDTPTAATHSLSCAAGPIICDFLSVKNSQALGRAVWYAGGQSTDAGGNSGWKFFGPARSAQGATMLNALPTPHY